MDRGEDAGLERWSLKGGFSIVRVNVWMVAGYEESFRYRVSGNYNYNFIFIFYILYFIIIIIIFNNYY